MYMCVPGRQGALTITGAGSMVWGLRPCASCCAWLTAAAICFVFKCHDYDAGPNNAHC